MMPSPTSERTPLLRAEPQNHQNASAIADNEVTASEVAQQGQGAAPQFTESGKSRTGSRGQVVAPDDGSTPTQETEDLVKFQKNGKLEGVGVWRFRCVFGGILMGYFVRRTRYILHALLITKIDCNV